MSGPSLWAGVASRFRHSSRPAVGQHSAALSGYFSLLHKDCPSSFGGGKCCQYRRFGCRVGRPRPTRSPLAPTWGSFSSGSVYATVVGGRGTPWRRTNSSYLSRESHPYLFMIVPSGPCAAAWCQPRRGRVKWRGWWRVARALGKTPRVKMDDFRVPPGRPRS